MDWCKSNLPDKVVLHHTLISCNPNSFASRCCIRDNSNDFVTGSCNEADVQIVEWQKSSSISL